MKKRFLAVLTAAALAASLSACAGGDKQADVSGESKEETTQQTTDGAAGNDTGTGQPQKLTFVLDWTPNTNHTGLYVALSKGYFKEEGLEVEIVQPPEDGAEVLVASGKAQFGMSFQDTMAPALSGENPLPITAIAAVIQHNTSGIISRKGEGLDTPKGLEGKKYATWNAPVEKAVIQNVVEGDGGDFSKVQLIPSTVTDEVSALKTKSVDAIWIFYAWAGVKTELEGLETDYFAFGDLNPVFDYYTPVIIGGNDFIEKNPETVRSFLRAVSKGYEDAKRDPEEAAEILLKAAPELDQELVMASQKYLADKYQEGVDIWGYMDPERWNRFYGWLNENNLVSSEIPENTGFTNNYLPE